MSKELLSRLWAGIADEQFVFFGFLNTLAFVSYKDSSGKRRVRVNPKLKTRVISEKNIDEVEVSELEHTISMPTWQARWVEQHTIGEFETTGRFGGEPKVGGFISQIAEDERWEYCQLKRVEFTGNEKNFRRWITLKFTEFGKDWECVPVIMKALKENDNEYWRELIDRYTVKTQNTINSTASPLPPNLQAKRNSKDIVISNWRLVTISIAIPTSIIRLKDKEIAELITQIEKLEKENGKKQEEGNE